MNTSNRRVLVCRLVEHLLALEAVKAEVEEVDDEVNDEVDDEVDDED